MLNTHLPAAEFIVMSDLLLACKTAHHFIQFSGFNIFIRCEMILDKKDSVFIENILYAKLLKDFDRRRSRYIITKNIIQLSFDKVAGGNALQSCMISKNLLRHGHWHTRSTSGTIMFILQHYLII